MSRAADLPRHAETRLYLRLWRKLGRNHVGRNRNRAENYCGGSFDTVTEAVAEIRSACKCNSLNCYYNM